MYTKHFCIEKHIFTNFFLFLLYIRIGTFFGHIAYDFYFEMIKGTLQNICHGKGKFYREGWGPLIWSITEDPGLCAASAFEVVVCVYRGEAYQP